MMPDEMTRYKSKVCLLGDQTVGKTSLIRKFVLDQFSDDYIPTIGTKVTKRDVSLEKGGEKLNISLMVWDINGQWDMFKESVAEFKNFKPPTRFFSNSNGVFIVCDLTRRETFTHIHFWYDNIVKELGYKIPTVLLGNKHDITDKVVLTQEEIQAMNKDFNFPFYYTSARTGENVEKAFQTLAELILVEYNKQR
jgi:small GTP-binding protein